MSEILINDALTVAYLPQSQSAVTLGKNQRPTAPLEKETGSTTEYARWGDDNLFPQNITREIEANTIIGSTLDWKARALYSGGIMYGSRSYDEKGEEKFTPFIDVDIEEFIFKSNVLRYLIEASTDLYYFYNVFPEIILSEDRSQVVSISAQEATFCRWARQDQNDGLIKKCFINANWDKEGSDYLDNSVPVIDPYYASVDKVKGDTSSKYIYPVSYPTPGKVYYQLAHWDSIRVSGWYEVAKAIPAFKKALFGNQVITQYHVEISKEYWSDKYPNWNSLPIEKKKELMTEELEAFDRRMSGIDNAGKSIMTSFEHEELHGKDHSYWKINPIDNKIKSGIYIEDSQEASSHILYALSVDPTIIGSAPGKGMGGGSGSDKREAFNMYISLCDVHAHLILEPLQFIAWYNGWSKKYPGFTWRFRRPILQTLDKVTPSKRETTTPDASNKNNSGS
ncbi:hypothetical protein [Xanthocytophaga agilis]|uniref:Uncharacterized protein n=1 Tax=Xanthocytophaga agilis TaxID=3048010 RepID=A0AAE3UCT7_9BACT|nr:hypothetical protein [Xanthocytophaga agilis]MDJ1500460.1 hypothetical protein [Xanthocytophaga agilis]